MHCAAERKEQGQNIFDELSFSVSSALSPIAPWIRHAYTVCHIETRYCRCSCNYVYFVHIVCMRHTHKLCIHCTVYKQAHIVPMNTLYASPLWHSTRKSHWAITLTTIFPQRLQYLHFAHFSFSMFVRSFTRFLFRLLFVFFSLFLSSRLERSLSHKHTFIFTFSPNLWWITCQLQGINEKLRGTYYLTPCSVHIFTCFTFFIIRFMLIFFPMCLCVYFALNLVNALRTDVNKNTRLKCWKFVIESESVDTCAIK